MAKRRTDRVTFQKRKFRKVAIKGRRKGGFPPGTIVLIPSRKKRRKKKRA